MSPNHRPNIEVANEIDKILGQCENIGAVFATLALIVAGQIKDWPRAKQIQFGIDFMDCLQRQLDGFKSGELTAERLKDVNLQ